MQYSKKEQIMNYELFFILQNVGTLLSQFNVTTTGEIVTAPATPPANPPANPAANPPANPAANPPANAPANDELFHLPEAFEHQDANYASYASYADFMAQANKPPKRKDKPKPYPEYSQAPSTSNNPYSAYQYEFPYQYPYNFFNMPPSPPLPPSLPPKFGADTKNKTKKKASSSTQTVKKASITPDKTIVPFISISVAPHQRKNVIGGAAQYDTDQPSSKSEFYSPDKQPAPDQAAYFNYLNTYTPNYSQQFGNQAYVTPYPVLPPHSVPQHAQHAQATDNKHQQLNPFNSRFPTQNGFNVPPNAANAYGYGYGYSPFNRHGYSPMMTQMPFYNVPSFAGTSSNLDQHSPHAKSDDTAQRSIRSKIHPVSSEKKKM